MITLLPSQGDFCATAWGVPIKRDAIDAFLEGVRGLLLEAVSSFLMV